LKATHKGLKCPDPSQMHMAATEAQTQIHTQSVEWSAAQQASSIQHPAYGIQYPTAGQSFFSAPCQRNTHEPAD